jgi:hypothetical protein
LRAWNGKPQAADDRSDRIEHSSGDRVEEKQQEATIDVWIIDQD